MGQQRQQQVADLGGRGRPYLLMRRAPGRWRRRTLRESPHRSGIHDVPKRSRRPLPRSKSGPVGHLRTFAENKSAAKDLLLHLGQKEQVDKLLWASRGYDVPPQASFFDHEVWLKEGPPRPARSHNYPIRGDEQLIVSGYPAPNRASPNAKMRDANLIPVPRRQGDQGGQIARRRDRLGRRRAGKDHKSLRPTLR